LNSLASLARRGRRKRGAEPWWRRLLGAIGKKGGIVP
jgi:hypothetical protein